MIDDDNSLREEMGETAALPPDDPRRQALERRLATEPGATKQEWRDLLLENQLFRDRLPSVDVPGDLEHRLLAVAVAAPRQRLSVRRGWVLAAAAIILLVLSVGLAHRYTAGARMRTVALLAINNHLNHLEDHRVQGETKRELESGLSAEVGFKVIVPELDRLELAGGRKCKLGTHSVAFSLWRDDVGNYSLFQFQPDRFGLPPTIEPQLVRSTQPAGAEHTCGAWIWTEGPHGYVFTGDPGSDLRQLSPGSNAE
jgi:hypothetical protein